MPKIIENLENRLIEEAKKQLLEAGYGALTIRSVAGGCGVGVGTVYNYFPSKDALVAAYMLQDWKGRMAVITQTSHHTDSAEHVVRCMYDQLRQYAAQHEAVLLDEAAAASFAGSFSRYHALLRSQLAEPLKKFCAGDFAPEFISEALLVWTVSGKSFDDIYSMVEKLF